MIAWQSISVPEQDDLSIKCFTREDLPAILKNEAQAGVYPWRESDFLSSMGAGHVCLGLKRQDKWLAHVVLSSVVDELELLILAVPKAYARRGYAALLLDAIFVRAASLQFQVVHLEVRQSNIAAIKLYEKLGFEQLGVRRNYYRNKNNSQLEKEDALLFSKSL